MKQNNIEELKKELQTKKSECHYYIAVLQKSLSAMKEDAKILDNGKKYFEEQIKDLSQNKEVNFDKIKVTQIYLNETIKNLNDLNRKIIFSENIIRKNQNLLIEIDTELTSLNNNENTL